MDAAAEHRATLPVRRWRVRRVLKWIGALSCFILILAISACLVWSVVAFRIMGFGFGIAGGAAYVPDEPGPAWGVEFRPVIPAFGRLELWSLLAIQPKLIDRDTQTLPLWIPLAAVGLPTAWLWYLDRRRPAAGACRCGYDLTGNTSGRCPECGQAVERAA